MVTREQLDSFHEYAVSHLDETAQDLTFDDLYMQWQLAQRSENEKNADVEAIRVALEEYRLGKFGRDSETLIEQLKIKYQLPELNSSSDV